LTLLDHLSKIDHLFSRAQIDLLPQLVGFDKALCWASYLLKILVDDPCFNIDKNVY